MEIIEIFFIAIGLAMDIFAVSICKGLSMKKINWKNTIILSVSFCVFHILMLTIGYLIGGLFKDFVEQIDHWIACILLTVIGANMIKEGIIKNEDKDEEKLDLKSILVLSIATSIDALTIGVTFAFFNVNILLSNIIVGVIALLMSIIGTLIGHKFGNKLENKSEIVGGVILILIGIKILLEHLGIISF